MRSYELTSWICFYTTITLVLYFIGYTELCYGIEEIADIKTLTKKVQDDTQGYFIPMILNAAGIGTAAFALISQRWTLLIFGGAYLVFVNVFFGFVNGSFKIS